MADDVKLTKLSNCGGCGAKVGAGMLAKLLDGIKVRRDPDLLVGFDKSDDASVYRVTDDLALVQTVDFFPPMVDDPYLFGQIAATNALSDIYAMGAEPKLAQNIMCIPKGMDNHAVREILRGGYDKVYEAGALITGGHSIFDEEPKYGLAVTGFVHPKKLLANSTAQAGDVLFLTKPLGIGIAMTAKKADMLESEVEAFCHDLMTTLNRAARDAMVQVRTHACTDVTGFSLMGHGLEMAQGADVSIEFYRESIRIIPGVLELAKDGIVPEGAYRNRSFAEEFVQLNGVPLEFADVLFDPETAGGLLIAVHPDDADSLERLLKGVTPWAARVGRVLPPHGDGKRIVIA